MRRATADSTAWQVLADLDPDIMLLQEVGGIPTEFLNTFSAVSDYPRTKDGDSQKFQLSILSKFELERHLPLESELDCVNLEHEYYSGNILGCTAKSGKAGHLNLISFYSPAWHIPDDRLVEVDQSRVKLVNNPKVYMTEILWKLLADSITRIEGGWVVAGDFNSSTTFDWMWGNEPRGNQEFIDRMNALGLSDCLSGSAKGLVPTFRNARGGKVIHQLDYIYVDNQLKKRLRSAGVVNDCGIFEGSLSDHLPVVGDFDD